MATDVERLEVLDVLRGWALCGLFFVHMLESYEIFWAEPHYEFATKVVFLLFSGKCFAILALCFGFSFYMLVDRHGPPNAAASLCYLRRLIILGAFGVIHSMLYRGDILVLLALLGAPLLFVSRVKSNAVLISIAAILFLQPPIMFDLFMAPGSGAAAAAYRDVSMSVYQHGGFAEVLRTNMWDGQIPKWIFMVESGRLLQAAGLILCGVVLGRRGFFKHLATTGRVQLMLLFGAVLAAGILHYWQKPLVDLGCRGGMSCETALGTLVQGWTQLVMTLGWVLAVCAVWVRFDRTLLRPFSFLGRATLSFYVLQSIVFVPLFYHFGAGLAEVLSPADRLVGAGAGALVQLWLATVWFKHFAYGPLEWVWRALTQGNWDVPFHRAGQPTPALRAQALGVEPANEAHLPAQAPMALLRRPADQACSTILRR